MIEKFRIVIVDDHPIVRSGVVRALEKQPQFVIVGEGESADDAIRITQEELPDIILLDISMPGGGIAAAKVISQACPAVKIVFLTVSEDEATISAAIEAGARGYILKGVRGSEFVKTLTSIAEDDAVVLPGLAARILSSMQSKAAIKNRNAGLMAQLSARETEILQHLAQGMKNREIGESLGLTERTVKHYMHNILQKLHVKNRVEAALLAEREFAKE
ncbi:MAG: response regulator transcription factor [Hyphomicrobiaceae bacterium]|nr:response regulator transcription factor [Hyphomicrobiaceae bacterium]MCC0007512.1 response regulator transcription factor [Hyphomicrobiaceae bacterium]